ncbi:DUF3099 domain-containing protein [Actinotalea sp. AC32]|nr:DUF3099 domain-containing protein [Actinotalea sp. AC32]
MSLPSSASRTPRRVRARTEHDAVQRITSAAPSRADDIAQRNKRYLWQMSTRVVCFVGAVAIDHWSRWVLAAGAVLLPYLAVVLANAGRERGVGGARESDPGTFLDPRGLPGGPGPVASPAAAEPPAPPSPRETP